MRYVFVVLITATAIINDGLANAATARISTFKLAKDPVKVTALQKAIAAMKKNDSALDTSIDFRVSWRYMGKCAWLS